MTTSTFITNFSTRIEYSTDLTETVNNTVGMCVINLNVDFITQADYVTDIISTINYPLTDILNEMILITDLC